MQSRRSFVGQLGGALLAGGRLAPGADRPRPNVLFVVIDDLRPELGCYGASYAVTPNLDRFAKGGTVFEQAYCQQAVCCPSRTSVLTGWRPDRTRVYDLVTHFRTTVPDAVTLPQWFQRSGYHTQAFGKIYHDNMDDPASWSRPIWPERSNGMQYVDEAALREGRIETLTWKKREAWQAPDVPDNALQDGQVADRAVEFLRRGAPSGKPWFLAVGFQKPHLPFVAPKKYFDLQAPVPPPRPAEPHVGAPALALHPFVELRGYKGIPATGPVPAEMTAELRRGYLAAMTYTDAQFGRVLSSTDLSNTVVVVWGDNGFHLGEYGLWVKTTNFELDTRVPLIFRTPWQKQRGTRTAALVELLDLYPTLADVCGLPPPAVDGVSFSRLLDDPGAAGRAEARSQFPRGDVMGRSIRTAKYRYTDWVKPDGSRVAEELYLEPLEARRPPAAAPNKEAPRRTEPPQVSPSRASYSEALNRVSDPEAAPVLAEARKRMERVWK